MQVFESIINQGNSIMYGFLLLSVFGIASVFFLFVLKGVQFRYFFHSIKLLTEKHEGGGMSGVSGYIVSTASRVGTGSMTGIVIAITVGGPGSLFWMWVMVFMGAALAVAESSLAQLYKQKDSKGNYVGGASYYIKTRLNNKVLGTIFAILLITCYSIFNGVQSNTISSALANYGVNIYYTAIALVIITGLILLSPKRETLTNACSFIVPVMGLPYILSGIIVFFMNISLVPEAIVRIVTEAFTPQSIIAGGIGTTIATGLARGLFSNEAGMGGAPHAAAATTTTHPVRQGLLQMLSCYTTTLVICSITGILLLLSPEAMQKSSEIKGIQLLQYAMSTHFGKGGAIFITFCAVLFAYSSVLGNFFYIRTGAASMLTVTPRFCSFLMYMFILLSVLNLL